MGKIFLELISKSLGLFYDLDLVGFVIIMLTEKNSNQNIDCYRIPKGSPKELEHSHHH